MSLNALSWVIRLAIYIICEVQWDDMASGQEYKGWKNSVNVSREDCIRGVFSWGIDSQE